MNDILLRLSHILEQRKEADPATSYVAGLYSKGTDAIVGKIAEEAAELVLAAKDENNHQIIYETADLWFHSLILLVHAGLDVNDVLAELDRRFGTSGLDEKAQRQIKT